MLEFLQSLTAYHWLALVLVILAAEMLLGTFDLLWIAAAAAVVSLLTWLVPGVFGGWQAQLILFAVAATAFTLMGRTVFSGMRNPPSSHPDLNDRMAKLIGVTATVTQNVRGGSGRVKVGDSEWSAMADHTADFQVGQIVRIVATEGNSVRVEPVT